MDTRVARVSHVFFTCALRHTHMDRRTHTGPCRQLDETDTYTTPSEIITVVLTHACSNNIVFCTCVHSLYCTLLMNIRVYLTLQTTDTFIQLEDQTSYTEVMVTVTPHTLWLQSDDSLSETGIFRSTPMGN